MLRIVERPIFCEKNVAGCPNGALPAEEVEEKLKAREWHVSGLVVCRASSSSCGNCFSSTPDHCINQGSCWRSLGTEVASPGSSCQTKSELQKRERKGVGSIENPSGRERSTRHHPKQRTRNLGHPEFREDAKHLKRGGVAGTAWSDQPV